MKDLASMASAVRAHMQVANPDDAEDSSAMWNYADIPASGSEVSPYQPSGNEKLDALVRALNPTFRYGATPGAVIPGDVDMVEEDGQVYYRAGADMIDFPHRSQFRSDADYRATLAHELTHWTGAYERAKRPHDPTAGLRMFFGLMPEGYPQEEITAEIGAALLLDAVGENPDMSRRAAYAAGWATQVDAERREEVIAKATRDAERAVSWMLAQV
jgi:hypothetical protein